jgi:hypothetical protein
MTTIIVTALIFFLVLGVIAMFDRIVGPSDYTDEAEPRASRGPKGAGTLRSCMECGESFFDHQLVEGICPECHERRSRARYYEDLGGARPLGSVELMDFYKILGAKEADSDEDLKRRYHRRAKEVHPDTAAGKNLSESALRKRTEEFRQLKDAYERIMQERARNR